MTRKFTIFFALLSLLLPGSALYAQDKSREEADKQFYEALEAQVERYTEQLNLEDWQVFYVDSILTHNMEALRSEIMALQAARVSSADYMEVASDKWMEATYTAFRKVLNDSQWEKYLKNGAKRDKAARDKRAAKRKQ
ncbi:MAG: hypothetical protein IJS62_08825 [Bacteroidales bacterium]|nr:hypothetical protein [Bacteroidales bacterium]